MRQMASWSIKPKIPNELNELNAGNTISGSVQANQLNEACEDFVSSLAVKLESDCWMMRANEVRVQFKYTENS